MTSVRSLLVRKDGSFKFIQQAVETAARPRPRLKEFKRDEMEIDWFNESMDIVPIDTIADTREYILIGVGRYTAVYEEM